MTSQLSREKAAQAWCKPSTSGKVMDVELAEAFAEILEEVWTKPWLGNATTGELLDEVKARVNCNYRTADSDSVEQKPTEPRTEREAMLRKALVGLLGSDGKAELDAMEAAMRSMPAPASDKAAAIDAIDALRNTL